MCKSVDGNFKYCRTNLYYNRTQILLNFKMEKVVKIFKSFEEQEKEEIKYYIQLTPEQRQKVAAELKQRFYGNNCPDVRKSYLDK